MKQRLPSLLGILVLAASCHALPTGFSSNSGIVGFQVDTGHQEAVSCLSYDAERALLFSAGDDGALRVWGDDLTQHAAIRISHLSIRMIALHPELPQVALVEVIDPGHSRISVWNWEEGLKLYDIELNDAPLFLSFSPRGTFIFYSVAESQSLRIHYARNGRASGYLTSTYGLVTFAAFSRNEGNVMTYQPSGKITYWRLNDGARIQEPVATLTDLSLLRMPTDNVRYLAAVRGDNLVVLDAVSGQTKGLQPIPGIMDLAVSPDGNRIACLTFDGKRHAVEYWTFTGSFLYTSSAYDGWKIDFPSPLSSVALASGNLFAGDTAGSLWTSPPFSEPRRFSENRLLNVTSLAVKEDVVALGSDRGIIIFTLSTNQYSYQAEGTISDFAYTIYGNPFAGRVGLRVVDGEELLIWDESENLGGIAYLDTWTGTAENGPAVSDSPFLDVTPLPGSLLTLEKTGRIRIVDEFDGATLFEYTSPGMRKVVSVDDDWLIGAGNSVNQYSGALVRINRSTQETVPMSGTSLLAYDLVYDPLLDVLYSLSVVRVGEDTVTTVREHKGPDFETERPILLYPGEDLGASLFFSFENRELYTSMGFGPVRIWNRGTVRSLEQSFHVPRLLKASGRLVYSLNLDSTVSIWDRKSGKLLTDVYLFNDLSWAAIFPNENTYISVDADEHLLFSRPQTSRPY